MPSIATETSLYEMFNVASLGFHYSEDMKGENARLRMENQALRAEITTLKHVSAYSQENFLIRIENQAMKRRIDDLEAQTHTLIRLLSENAKKDAERQEQRDAVDSVVVHYHDKTAILKDEISALKLENEELKEQKTAVDSVVLHFHDKLIEAEERLRDMRISSRQTSLVSQRSDETMKITHRSSHIIPLDEDNFIEIEVEKIDSDVNEIVAEIVYEDPITHNERLLRTISWRPEFVISRSYSKDYETDSGFGSCRSSVCDSDDECDVEKPVIKPCAKVVKPHPVICSGGKMVMKC